MKVKPQDTCKAPKYSTLEQFKPVEKSLVKSLKVPATILAAGVMALSSCNGISEPGVPAPPQTYPRKHDAISFIKKELMSSGKILDLDTLNSSNIPYLTLVDSTGETEKTIKSLAQSNSRNTYYIYLSKDKYQGIRNEITYSKNIIFYQKDSLTQYIIEHKKNKNLKLQFFYDPNIDHYVIDSLKANDSLKAQAIKYLGTIK